MVTAHCWLPADWRRVSFVASASPLAAEPPWPPVTGGGATSPSLQPAHPPPPDPSRDSRSLRESQVRTQRDHSALRTPPTAATLLSPTLTLGVVLLLLDCTPSCFQAHVCGCDLAITASRNPSPAVVVPQQPARGASFSRYPVRPLYAIHTASHLLHWLVLFLSAGALAAPAVGASCLRATALVCWLPPAFTVAEMLYATISELSTGPSPCLP